MSYRSIQRAQVPISAHHVRMLCLLLAVNRKSLSGVLCLECPAWAVTHTLCAHLTCRSGDQLGSTEGGTVLELLSVCKGRSSLVHQTTSLGLFTNVKVPSCCLAFFVSLCQR
ncbi:hypothetical protein BGZ63DRAFT_385375 [Mariannaea sp. PMI_226]|nr:hypothetical protein BGZ63DRAFT_385375 [Mariannaea sp. PMI_226]